ncbi:fluoride efflux transporter FluC [uncultured Amnibacterium sp.]|uniref:fluoride efflux transporter FluC n=1 Tax=uncultured Amnibacterium sp. TaxID=1631851 RepID=UPI0035CC1F3E
MTPPLLLLLAVAGGVGAALRLLVDGLVRDRFGGRLPWGTALINLSGSFLLGLLTGWATRGLPEAVLLVAGTGLLGGYTTFSTASVETVRLLQQRRVAASLGYGLGVLVLSIALAVAGVALTA